VHGRKFLPVIILNSTHHQGNYLMYQGEEIYVLPVIMHKQYEIRA